MMSGGGRCAICDLPITKDTDSNEHVIPNSIGGRKKVRGFICNACNNSVGKTWDAKLAAQLNWFSVSIGIDRDRGKAPDEVVQTVDGKEFRIGPNGAMTLKDPFFQIVESDGKANVKMFARTPSEARKMFQGIKKKYPAFDLDAALREIEIEAFKVDQPLQHRLELGGPEVSRSLVKTSLAQCFQMGILPHQCEIGLHTLRTPTDNSEVAPGYGLEVVAERPIDKLFHLVAIYGNPVKRTLSAYVEYFGVLKTFINLSKQYEGDEIAFAYSFDPRTGKELNLSVRWDLYPAQIELAFKEDMRNTSHFNSEVGQSYLFATKKRIQRERRFVHRKLLAEVLNELGLNPDSIPDESHRDEIHRLMTERLGSIEERVSRILCKRGEC